MSVFRKLLHNWQTTQNMQGRDAVEQTVELRQSIRSLTRNFGNTAGGYESQTCGGAALVQMSRKAESTEECVQRLES